MFLGTQKWITLKLSKKKKNSKSDPQDANNVFTISFKKKSKKEGKEKYKWIQSIIVIFKFLLR